MAELATDTGVPWFCSYSAGIGNPEKGFKENKPEKQLPFNLISDALGLLAHTEPVQVN